VVLAAAVLVGLGGGVFEALLNPLVQDAHPEDSGRYLNITNAFFSVGILVSVLAVGELLTRGVSWRLLVAGIGAVALVSGMLFFPLVRAERIERRNRHSRPSVRRQVRAILGDRLFWVFLVAMFCGGGAEGGFTFWSASYAQLNLGAMARGGAFATAAFSAGMVTGRLASGHFVSQNRLHVLIIASALIGVGASFGAWAVSGLPTFMAILFVAGLSIACFWPSIQSHAAMRIKLDSTMLFILLSVGGIPGFGLTSWIMGIIAEKTDLRTSLLVIPGLLLVLALVMVLALFLPDTERVVDRKDKPKDGPRATLVE
jgi:fucose permease